MVDNLVKPKDFEIILAERDEALNQLDSAKHSVDVLENRVSQVMTERDALSEKLAMAVALLDDIAKRGRCEFALVRATLTAIKEGRE